MGQTTSSTRGLSEAQLASSARSLAKLDLMTITKLSRAFRELGVGFGMVKSQFSTWMAAHTKISEKNIGAIFQLMDTDANGRIDALEYLGGLAMIIDASFEDKARFCFELYDFNISGSISPFEMTLMMRSAAYGLFKLVEYRDSLLEDDHFESLTRRAFRVYDKDESHTMEFREFFSWARGQKAVHNYVRLFQTTADVEGEDEDSAPEAENEELSGVEDSGVAPARPIARRRRAQPQDDEDPFAAFASSGGDESMAPSDAEESGEAAAAAEARRHEACEPSKWSAPAEQVLVPEASLTLEWVHGMARGVRSAVRYVGNGSVFAYPAASLAIVFDAKAKTQTVYMGHDNDVVALAAQRDTRTEEFTGVVATGQRGSGAIHVWSCAERNASAPTTIAVLDGFHREGIALLAFSPDGEHLASVGSDDDHSVAVWRYRAKGGAPKLVASAKGNTAPLLALAWDPNGAELAVCGTKTVRFMRIARNSRALKVRKAYIGSKGKLQTFVSAAYLGGDCIIGTADGELYRFDTKSGSLSSVVQAHMARQPVTALWEWEGGLVSGSRDGTVKLWDMQLVETDSIDLGGDPTCGGDSGITSVCTASGTDSPTVLVATRASEVYEIALTDSGASAVHKPLMRGHFGGVRGLASHPIHSRFVTASEDHTVRMWDVTTRTQQVLCVGSLDLCDRSHISPDCRLAASRLPAACSTAHFSPDGRCLAVGLSSGAVAVLDGNDVARGPLKTMPLSISSGPNNSDGVAENAVEVVKYSPDGSSLAVGSRNGCIYLFDVRKTGSSSSGNGDGIAIHAAGKICKSSSDKPVVQLDWSLDSRHLRSVNAEGNLTFWDGGGNKLMHGSAIRDDNWSSASCTRGWDVGGIARRQSALPVSCARDHAGDVLVVGDESKFKHGLLRANVSCIFMFHSRISYFTGGAVSLYRYPCPTPGAKAKAYDGHAGAVSNVCVMRGDTNIVTLGMEDCCIMQWSYGRHAKEHPLALANRIKNPQYDADLEAEIHRAPEGEGGAAFRAAAAASESTIAGHSGTVSMPWLGSVVAPDEAGRTSVNPKVAALGSLDADLELKWVHGYRGHDCRNNIAFVLGADKLAYPAAALGIVLDLKHVHAPVQNIMKDHIDDVVCLAVSKAGDLVATGEVGSKAKVVLWDPETMVGKDFPVPWRGGVGYLAFNENGTFLVAVGMDASHTIALWDLSSGRLTSTAPSGPDATLGVAFVNNDTFVTVGVDFVKFWGPRPGESHRAIFGAPNEDFGNYVQTALSVTAIPPADGKDEDAIVVTGMRDGSLYVWDTTTHTLRRVFKKVHSGAVNSLAFCDESGYLFSGGADGVILRWRVSELRIKQVVGSDATTNGDAEEKSSEGNATSNGPMKVVDMAALKESGVAVDDVQGSSGSIRAIAVRKNPDEPSETILAFGTRSNRIYDAIVNDKQSKPLEAADLELKMRGHFEGEHVYTVAPPFLDIHRCPVCCAFTFADF